VRTLVSACADRGIGAVSLFAFSTENWRRPKAEVAALMLLLRHFVKKEVKAMIADGVRLTVLGDKAGLPDSLQALIADAEAKTAQGARIRLNVAINYGGHWDVVNAVHQWQKANPGKAATDMTEQDLESHLSTAGMPPPDLLIRTGGESRISNFLIWQMAYTEFYFTPTLWPDFDEVQLDAALASFAERDRRFGAEGVPVPVLAEDAQALQDIES
jgi:undecaprenyl diphosphate synthase